MILYLQALGFTNYDEKDKAEALVADIVKNPTNRYLSNYTKDHIKVEYYKDYGKGFGLMVRGILNEEEALSVYSLVPYAVGSYLVDTHEIDVVRVNKKDAFNAYCEESKSGTPISFFLQNVVDYLDVEDKPDIYVEGVRLVGYCVEGTVILPIDKDEDDLELEEEAEALREQLIEQARLGDEDALDLLEDEVIEASEMLKERLKSEDILSILEGFFIPIEDSDDVYSLLGEIIDVKTRKNVLTKESIYIMKIKCMSLYMDIYITKNQIVGKPTKGMRFKGTCWIHGLIEFSEGHIEELIEDEDDDDLPF